MNIVGIDPGITGAIAQITDVTIPLVFDMPVLQLEKNKNKVSATGLAYMMRDLNPDVVCLERVHAMPKQGVASTFNFGMGYGIVQGVVLALNIPLVYINPNDWKTYFKLRGKDKDMARTLAQEMYPFIDLSKKKHIGRADALLITKHYVDHMTS